MSINIVVPDLGESVVEATVANWLKQEGEAVKAGEAIVSLETDKVDLDVPAPQDGVLRKIERQAGEDVRVGEVLAVIEAGGDGAAPRADGGSAAPARESDQPQKDAQDAADPKQDGEEPEAKPTPVAKRMAQERGVDLAAVEPAGPGGRVTKRDVEEYIARQDQEQPAPQQPAVPAPQPATAPVPPFPPPAPLSTTAPSGVDGQREVQRSEVQRSEVQSREVQSREAQRSEERIRMSRRRRTIAERLVEAQQTAAILTTFNEIDMTAVMEMRQRKRDDFKTKHGVSLGFMSFFVKAAIGALKLFPALNGSIEGNEIVLKHYYDIGIAVGADEGLVVPVLRDADRMSFAEIEKVIQEMANKAREGTLSLDDLRGGTFTISNGGVFGSLLSTPILNPPQVGILGLHKIEQRAVVLENQIVARPMMYVALSYDHRIVDGREAVQFLVRVKQLIEDPEELLLAG
jgi:2-oxoglutarate dehydrogenase E2 component (dihydrolipoamide succinyltransferase)